MTINTSGMLVIKCNNCGKQSSISCDNLEWKCVESSQRQMGVENNFESQYEFDCKCGQKISIKINILEYPAGAFNSDDYQITGGQVIQKCMISFDV